MKATRFWGQSSTPLLLHERAIVVFCLIISIHFTSSWDCKCLLSAPLSNTLCTKFFFFLSSISRGENWGEGVILKRKINSLRCSKKYNWNNILQIVPGRSFEHSVHAMALFQSHWKIKQQLWLWQSSKSQLCVTWKTTSWWQNMVIRWGQQRTHDLIKI